MVHFGVQIQDDVIVEEEEAFYLNSLIIEVFFLLKTSKCDIDEDILNPTTLEPYDLETYFSYRVHSMYSNILKTERG